MMNKPEILLSIALVTRNRPESLDRCLKSLRAQNIQPFEVIVSDDSDPNFTAETEAIAKKWNCKYIPGPRRGLYANRNYVALHCQGTHIRTMDDDHEFPEGHFEQCILAIQSDPQSIWIIGEYLPEEKEKQIPPPCPGQLHPRGFSYTPEETQNCWAISDGASIYSREIFNQGIRYIEYFKFGASYLEFGSRLHWLGYRIRHLDNTYIIHHFDRNNRSYINKEINIASRCFAILCHSFIYQKTLKNQCLSLMEIFKQILFKFCLNYQWIKIIISNYREHYSIICSK